MTNKIKVGELASQINKLMEEFNEEVIEATKTAVETVAKESKEEIKANSRVDTGRYQKGWRTKTTTDTPTQTVVSIYNANAPGLVHLLEDGHKTVNGRRTVALPHVKPVEEKLEERLMSETLKNIKKGS